MPEHDHDHDHPHRDGAVDSTGHGPGRALRLGVCGPVGTGKSSLIAMLCRELSGRLELGVVTNDIYTDEDARFLRAAGVLDADRIRAVETGACPHTAIRDDVTANAMAVVELRHLARLFQDVLNVPAEAADALALADSIDAGIREFGVVEHARCGRCSPMRWMASAPGISWMTQMCPAC